MGYDPLRWVLIKFLQFLINHAAYKMNKTWPFLSRIQSSEGILTKWWIMFKHNIDLVSTTEVVCTDQNIESWYLKINGGNLEKLTRIKCLIRVRSWSSWHQGQKWKLRTSKKKESASYIKKMYIFQISFKSIN